MKRINRIEPSPARGFVRSGLAAFAIVVALAESASAQCAGNWVIASGTGPPPRQNHAMVYDSGRDVVVLFGGYRGGFGFYDDTWEWDGEFWSQVVAPGPAARGNHALSYDAMRQKVVLFGGAADGGAYLGDTWEYDGAARTWTEITPAVAPVARYNAAMCYDAARTVSVLFGGYSGVREGDTWTWDGASWVQVATTGCTPRNGHAMTFDAARGRTVLFGGFNGARLGDTWEWDGLAWAQRSTTGPSGRQYLALAYHGPLARVMLYGGQTGACSTCREDDTWSWDGTSWTLLSDAQASLRDQHALVYDAGRGQLLLFGGYAGAGLVLEDSWAWLVQLAGDLNGDLAVGISDLTILLSHFGTADPHTYEQGDLDGDGDVDLSDLTAFLASFGATCP